MSELLPKPPRNAVAASRTITGMEHHDCEPPIDRRVIDAPMTWTCPECGDLWRVIPFLPIDPPQESDFAMGDHVSPPEWVRVGKADTNAAE